MLLTEREQLRDDITAWVKRYGQGRAALIPVLQMIQGKYHEVSPYSMQEVADHLNIHPVEVYSVVTFYGFLHEKHQGNFVIRLCRTISCDFSGKDKIARQLENELDIRFGETTRDGRFSLQWASCIGMCDQGPAMLVNDQVFTRVTPERIHEIIGSCRRTFGPAVVPNEEMEVSA